MELVEGLKDNTRWKVTHRMFIKGGGVNRIPIMP